MVHGLVHRRFRFESFAKLRFCIGIIPQITEPYLLAGLRVIINRVMLGE